MGVLQKEITLLVDVHARYSSKVPLGSGGEGQILYLITGAAYAAEQCRAIIVRVHSP